MPAQRPGHIDPDGLRRKKGDARTLGCERDVAGAERQREQVVVESGDGGSHPRGRLKPCDNPRAHGRAHGRRMKGGGDSTRSVGTAEPRMSRRKVMSPVPSKRFCDTCVSNWDRVETLTPDLKSHTVPGSRECCGAFYHWKDLAPFGIESPSDFLLPGPPSLTSNSTPKDYLEVKTMGAGTAWSAREDRTEVVRLYAVSSPSFALSMAARQIAVAKGLSLTENARAFTLIMMGINDSLIASFYNKYHYNFWRPETRSPRERWTATTRRTAMRRTPRNDEASFWRRRPRHHFHEQCSRARIPTGCDDHQALAVATEIYKNNLRPIMTK